MPKVATRKDNATPLVDSSISQDGDQAADYYKAHLFKIISVAFF
jgi:hypothetical protein